MSIYEAIETAAQCLRCGAHPNIVRIALINDGFSANKAGVIIGWANQKIKNNDC